MTFSIKRTNEIGIGSRSFSGRPTPKNEQNISALPGRPSQKTQPSLSLLFAVSS